MCSRGKVALQLVARLLCCLQGYLAYDNTTMAQRPAVVIIPDYDGIGPYELWRANLLAQLGYAGLRPFTDIHMQATPSHWPPVFPCTTTDCL